MTVAGAQPPVSGACLSDLILDGIIAGERPRDEQATHLTDCELCAARLELLRAEAEASRERVEILVARAREVARRPAPASTTRRGWLHGLLLAGGLAATASVVAVGLLPIDGERSKGTAIGFWVQRDGNVQPGVSGALFEPGDALRFTVSSGEAGYFLLVGIESSGEVAAYHPFDGNESVSLPAGSDQRLPHSLVLDDAPGPELLLGIFSPEPVSMAQVRGALSRAGSLTPDAVARLDLPGALHLVVLNKGE